VDGDDRLLSGGVENLELLLVHTLDPFVVDEPIDASMLVTSGY
jgi:hypothetical protein